MFVKKLNYSDKHLIKNKHYLKTLVFPSTPESVGLARLYRYDEWIVNRFMQFVPDVYTFLETLERHPPRYIRTNTLKIDSKKLKSKLLSKGFKLKETALEDVIAVEKALYSIGATTEYLLGYYYIQDLSSCFAVEALDIGKDQTVLDMASAPGGKTTFIAQKMENTGCLIAIEPNPKRVRSILYNIARCGVINTCVFTMDGRQVSNLDLKFDRVLLDAPCSGEGVIAKDNDRKTNHKPEDVEYCALIQRELIEAAVKVVKPGGLLVYSTCSFAPEENENIVNYLLDKFDIQIEPFQYGNDGLVNFGDFHFRPDLKNTKRFYPHIHKTLGFYIAKIRVNN
jgi:NOL1/NOP2/sun family putative RNA methylase